MNTKEKIITEFVREQAGLSVETQQEWLSKALDTHAQAEVEKEVERIVKLNSDLNLKIAT